MVIRLLQETDFDAYDSLRARALQDNPEAFLRSHQEEYATTAPETRRQRLLEYFAQQNVIFVADEAGELVGMVGLTHQGAAKVQHVAVIWGVYVMPDQRGKRLGSQLMEQAIQLGSTWEGIEQLKLTVVTSNTAARALYKQLGFTEWGIEWQACKVNGVYWDLVYMSLTPHKP